MSILVKLRKLVAFVGTKVTSLLVADVLLGVLWFLSESIFLLIFNGFLVSFGLILAGQSHLPDWYPRSIEFNFFILITYGAIRSILTALKKIVPSRAAQHFTALQRERIISQSFLEAKLNQAEAVSLFGEITSKAGQFILHFGQCVSGLISILLFVLFSLRLAPIETIVGIALLALFFIPLKKFNAVFQKHGKTLVSEWDEANKGLIAGINNIMLLTIYNTASKECEKSKQTIHRFESQFLKYINISSILSAAPVLFGMIVIGLSSVISIKVGKTSSEALLAFLYLFLRISQNMSQLNSSLSYTFFYKQTFLELWNKIPADNSSNKKLPPSTQAQMANAGVNIDIKDLSFKYNDRFIFQNFNLNISPGDVVFIKGESGAGKSTLIKLLLGINKPSGGTITVGNISPQELVAHHSREIGYVGPQALLFPESIKENILYGNPYDIPLSTIHDQLIRFGLSDIIEREGGLEKKLNEIPNLSTGQAQRICFIRAILRTPKLLILDEATSNLDSESEEKIFDWIKNNKNKATIIAISHRHSFESIATKVVEIG